MVNKNLKMYSVVVVGKRGFTTFKRNAAIDTLAISSLFFNFLYLLSGIERNIAKIYSGVILPIVGIYD